MIHTAEAITTRPWALNLLAQPVLARLATANPTTLQPHVVPVWFEWDGESIWISSFDSTRKMRDLIGNPRVSIVVDTAEADGTVRGIVFEGKADVIKDPSAVIPRSTSIYERYLGKEGVLQAEPASWIVDPENRVIRLRPEKIYTWG